MDDLVTFMASNLGNLLTIWNLAYDTKDQTDDAKINEMMESLEAIETTMDTEYDHIVSMHDMMIDKQTRITSMFNYYQEMVNGFNTIMVLILGITISLFKPYIEQPHFLGWWVVIWVGCFFFELVAIIEGVFISVRLSYAGAEFINGQTREQRHNRWIKIYDLKNLESISAIIQVMMISFLISMIFLIIGVHLMFYQDLNEKDPTFITLSGILVGIFFIMRFLFNYGYLLNFQGLNLLQLKLDIQTNQNPLHKPLADMIKNYNKINVKMGCLQSLWEIDKKTWISMLCNKASGEDCDDSSLFALESNLDYVITEFLARGEKQKYIVLRISRRMKAITRKLRLHDWRINTLFNNKLTDDGSITMEVEEVSAWNISYVGFWVVSGVGMIILATINFAWLILAFLLLFALSIVVGVLASLQTLLLAPCRGWKTDGLWNFFNRMKYYKKKIYFILFFWFWFLNKRRGFLNKLMATYEALHSKEFTELVDRDNTTRDNEDCIEIQRQIGTASENLRVRKSKKRPLSNLDF
jgi:hypothetical protein